jgi:hypothetical protein
MMSNGEPTDDMFNLVLNLGLILLPAIVLYNVKFVIGRILSNGRESECECDLDCSDCSDETVKPTLTQTTQTCEIDSGSESDDESGSESDGINHIINKFKTDDDDIFMTELNEHINTILKDLD